MDDEMRPMFEALTPERVKELCHTQFSSPGVAKSASWALDPVVTVSLSRDDAAYLWAALTSILAEHDDEAHIRPVSAIRQFKERLFDAIEAAGDEAQQTTTFTAKESEDD